MANPIDRGTYDPQIQGTVTTVDWSTGGSYAIEYKGLSPARVQALLEANKPTATRAVLTTRYGTADLRLEWAGANGNSAPPNSLEVTQDRWEIAEPGIERDLFQHYFFLYTLESWCSTDEQEYELIGIIRRAAERAKSTSNITATEASLTAELDAWFTAHSITPPLSYEAALDFYRLYANNHTHFQDSTYSVRHTTNVPAYWTRNLADSNINKILTHAQFKAEVTNTTLWNDPMPPRLIYKLDQATTDFAALRLARRNFAFGWLKSPSAEATAARGRVEITTKYTFDQWSTKIYSQA